MHSIKTRTTTFPRYQKQSKSLKERLREDVERLKCLDYCPGIFDEANEDNLQSDDQQSQISLTVFIVLL